MQIIKSITDTLKYPVGEFMGQNFPIIDQMAVELMKLIEEKYQDTHEVIFLCRGSSGAIIAALMAKHIWFNSEWTSNIFHIKKDGESSHGSGIFTEKELFNPSSVVVMVDDIVATGGTIEAMLDKVQSVTPQKPHILCVSGGIHSSVIKKWDFPYVICG